MKKLSYRFMVGAVLLVGLAAAGPVRAEQPLTTSDEMKWVDGPASLRPGSQYVILEGDPKKPGPFTMRIKVPAGYKFLPHRHPAVEHATVISGSLNMMMGEDLDPKKAKYLPAGSFILIPAETKHASWTDEGVVIQVHGVGPWMINYCDPKDDPRNQ